MRKQRVASLRSARRRTEARKHANHFVGELWKPEEEIQKLKPKTMVQDVEAEIDKIEEEKKPTKKPDKTTVKPGKTTTKVTDPSKSIDVGKWSKRAIGGGIILGGAYLTAKALFGDKKDKRDSMQIVIPPEATSFNKSAIIKDIDRRVSNIGG